MPGTAHPGIDTAVQVIGYPVCPGAGKQNSDGGKKQPARGWIAITGNDCRTDPDKGEQDSSPWLQYLNIIPDDNFISIL